MNVTRGKRQEARGKRLKPGVALRPFSGSGLSPLTSGLNRRGISLTEVLIAMGILTLGLLGVAALFPVGGYYMQKAEISDRGSAIAQNVMSDIVARGMLNPAAWWMWERGTIYGVGSVSGSGKFSRNVAQAMRQQATALANDPTLTTAQRQKKAITEFGSAFVIDPIGAASINVPAGVGYPNSEKAGNFPVNAYWITPTGTTPTQLQPWAIATGSAKSWPIHRITLLQAPQTTMSSAVANRLFSSTDDLSTDLPARDDQPAMQTWRIASNDLNGDGLFNDPVVRQFQGDYSWIVSVSPNNSAARDALARNPENYPYEVSVVVFYKRIVGKTDPADQSEMVSNLDPLSSERMAKAYVISSGLSGGELLLESIDTATTESPFTNLKVGQWIMLCGPHPSSTDTAPTFVMHWYQVLSIEGKDTKLDTSGNPTTSSAPDRRLVALRGPEWPWQPGTGTNNLSNNLWVCIFPGAVAVHTKTLKLEGPLGSAYSAGWSAPGTSGNSNSQAPSDWYFLRN